MAITKHAVLIGIKEYQLPRLNNLKGTVNDVISIKEMLMANYGFESSNIKTLIDNQATRSSILEATNNLKLTTKPNDFVFIYFSGHGTSSAQLPMEQYTGGLFLYTNCYVFSHQNCVKTENF
ncbi:MAG: caspase family protein [Desulfobacterales bacterium]|nr:caspase family protein [Desulfobacterales bacterium]